MSPRRRRLVVAGGVAAVLAGLSSCSSDPSSTADERAVCDDLHAVADDLAAGRSVGALTSLDDLSASVAATANDALAEGGRVFFEAIAEPTDPSSLTMEQTVAEGDRVLAEGGAGLDAIGQECERLGQPVVVDMEALDPDQPRRSPYATDPTTTTVPEPAAPGPAAEAPAP